MSENELEKPLKVDEATKRRPRPRLDGVAALALTVGLAIAGIGAWALLVKDPLGGEPVVTASIERSAPRPTAAVEGHGAEQSAAAPEPSHRDGVPIVKPGDPMPKAGPVIIRIPGADDAPAGAPASGGVKPGAVSTAMLEESRYGPLPRIAADGKRPVDVYARRQPVAQGTARVALIVTGLGVGREATTAAMKALPPEVTVAFSPYAQDVAALVEQARESGHEVLIQAPMEPFAYPSNDPGPQTLLTSLPAPANLERLRWTLGRAKGYVGVAALGGGKFLSDDTALAPVFTELARRGLIFIGQASGGDSRFPAIAEQAGLLHLQAAAPVDGQTDAGAIDAALGDLEREAKLRGAAVGWASATPLTLKRIEAWRAGLAARGVALAPVSAAIGAPGKS